MEFRYFYIVALVLHLGMYYIEKDNILKNRYFLWVLFFMLAIVGDIGLRVLRILESGNG